VVIPALHESCPSVCRVQEWQLLGTGKVTVEAFISDQNDKLTAPYLAAPLHIHVMHNMTARASAPRFQRL
jgi:hypothetical protein